MAGLDLLRLDGMLAARTNQPPRMWPAGRKGSTRSQTILATARNGTASRAPGTPQSIYQKNNEIITNTGFKVNRLAKIIGVIVSPSAMCIIK
jgi:hypothetical protein